jgi:hypothetical protein
VQKLSFYLIWYILVDVFMVLFLHRPTEAVEFGFFRGNGEQKFDKEKRQHPTVRFALLFLEILSTLISVTRTPKNYILEQCFILFPQLARTLVLTCNLVLSN